MLRLMKHRAPDGGGFVQVDDELCIGMGRLAIVDPDARNVSPYQYRGHTITFNGEIYNYEEIKDTLRRQHNLTFETDTDTEVLLKAYIVWGPKCLNAFNGMFAFAIHDGKKTFIARDIAGEKPLYYAQQPFRFASEAKALDFQCNEFPPAHYGTYENGHLSITRWWYPQRVAIDPDRYLEQFEYLLADAVRIRIPRDTDVALYYSGGIDSTLISSFFPFQHKLVYKDGEYQEEFLRMFPKILWHLDYPISSFSPFGLWKLGEEAKRKHVKVVISGEGADELFGGYVRYIPNEFNRVAAEKFPSYKGMFPHRDMMTDEFNGNMRHLLRMGDRMAAAHGLENRCPFLDRRIIEFAHSLPMELKIKGMETKVILRQLLKKRVPEYMDMEKKGLYCSVNRWIGSKETFDKNDYLKYQNDIWKQFS